MVNNRFEIMKNLLDESKFFKLVCGAGNEDIEEVKRLSILYTLAGAKGLDISADPNIVKACVDGIDYAFYYAKKININLTTRPFITVSVGMKGDNHVRKAFINSSICINCNLCISVCPTNAISNDLVITKEKCIGCGNCSSVCPIDKAIIYEHQEKELWNILPKCLKEGAEHIELHASIAEDEIVLKEWEIINKINSKNHVSVCLDRTHLSDFALVERVKKLKKISGERLIIQADGIPMSGNEDDFNTTLQAVAIADIINKKFNKYFDDFLKTWIYKKNNEINILISGGTNSQTSQLAKQTNVKFQGISIGTFARKIVKDILINKNFYSDINIISNGYLIAKSLVSKSIGEIYF